MTNLERKKGLRKAALTKKSHCSMRNKIFLKTHRNCLKHVKYSCLLRVLAWPREKALCNIETEVKNGEKRRAERKAIY